MPFQPSDAAITMAQELAQAEDQQREVLLEAVKTGTESGRTICGSEANSKDPVEGSRTFGSVVLPGCTLSTKAIMHGGGGHDLSRPTLSVIDMADPVFTPTAASMVVGAEKSEIVHSPRDVDMADAQMAFQNVLGLEFETPQELMQAINSNRLLVTESMREELRQELDGLISTVPTSHPQAIQQASVSSFIGDPDVALVALRRSKRSARRTRHEAGQIFLDLFSFDLESVDINLAQLIVSQFGDALVLLGFLWAFGGRPQTLIAGRAS